MNIDDLTYREIKEFKSIFNAGSSCSEKNSIYKSFIGKYVICRTRNEGINAGYVKELDNTGVILEKARRIYYHEPKDKKLSWYEGVSVSGLGNSSKISGMCEKLICEDYSLTICTSDAEESIIGFPTNEQ